MLAEVATWDVLYDLNVAVHVAVSVPGADGVAQTDCAWMRLQVAVGTPEHWVVVAVVNSVGFAVPPETDTATWTTV
jgi:hypothetical protein